MLRGIKINIRVVSLLLVVIAALMIPVMGALSIGAGTCSSILKAYPLALNSACNGLFSPNGDERKENAFFEATTTSGQSLHVIVYDAVDTSKIYARIKLIELAATGTYLSDYNKDATSDIQAVVADNVIDALESGWDGTSSTGYTMPIADGMMIRLGGCGGAVGNPTTDYRCVDSTSDALVPAIESVNALFESYITIDNVAPINTSSSFSPDPSSVDATLSISYHEPVSYFLDSLTDDWLPYPPEPSSEDPRLTLTQQINGSQTVTLNNENFDNQLAGDATIDARSGGIPAVSGPFGNDITFVRNDGSGNYDGLASMDIRAVDFAGNIALDSTAFLIDTTGPTISAATTTPLFVGATYDYVPNEFVLSGTIDDNPNGPNGDNAPNDEVVGLNATMNYTVTQYNFGTSSFDIPVGSVTLVIDFTSARTDQVNGTWTTGSIDALGDWGISCGGLVRVALTATDALGNVSNVSTKDIVIDSQAPVVTDLVALPVSARNDFPVTFRANISDNPCVAETFASDIEQTGVVIGTSVPGYTGPIAMFAMPSSVDAYGNGSYEATITFTGAPDSAALESATIDAADEMGNAGSTLFTDVFDIDTSAPAFDNPLSLHSNATNSGNWASPDMNIYYFTDEVPGANQASTSWISNTADMSVQVDDIGLEGMFDVNIDLSPWGGVNTPMNTEINAVTDWNHDGDSTDANVWGTQQSIGTLGPVFDCGLNTPMITARDNATTNNSSTYDTQFLYDCAFPTGGIEIPTSASGDLNVYDDGSITWIGNGALTSVTFTGTAQDPSLVAEEVSGVNTVNAYILVNGATVDSQSNISLDSQTYQAPRSLNGGSDIYPDATALSNGETLSARWSFTTTALGAYAYNAGSQVIQRIEIVDNAGLVQFIDQQYVISNVNPLFSDGIHLLSLPQQPADYANLDLGNYASDADNSSTDVWYSASVDVPFVAITSGPDGVVDSTVAVDDIQIYAPAANIGADMVAISAGPNGILDTAPVNDDVEISVGVGEVNLDPPAGWGASPTAMDDEVNSATDWDQDSNTESQIYGASITIPHGMPPVTATGAYIASVEAEDNLGNPATMVGDGSWLRNPANGHLYKTTAPDSWANTEAAAVAEGGHLVTMNDDFENTWVTDNIAGAAVHWIGYNDIASEGSFVWVSGETPSYTNWTPGEPNNSGNEDGVQLNWGGLYEWNDYPDGSSWPGIIESRAGSTLTISLDVDNDDPTISEPLVLQRDDSDDYYISDQDDSTSSPSDTNAYLSVMVSDPTVSGVMSGVLEVSVVIPAAAFDGTVSGLDESTLSTDLDRNGVIDAETYRMVDEVTAAIDWNESGGPLEADVYGIEVDADGMTLDGLQEFVVTATDKAQYPDGTKGNFRDDSNGGVPIQFIVDSMAPTADLVQPADGTYISTMSPLTFSGTVSDDVPGQLDSGIRSMEITAEDNGFALATYSLGFASLEATATQDVRPIFGSNDTTGPVVNISYPQDSLGADEIINANWSLNTSALIGQACSFLGLPLTYDITADIIDNAGNLNNDVYLGTVTVECTQPGLNVANPSNGSFVSTVNTGNIATIDGYANDTLSGVYRVQYSLDAGVSWTDVTNSPFLTHPNSVYWYLNWDTTGLPDGSYNFLFRAIDFAQNEQLAGGYVSWTVRLDNTSPSSKISTPLNNTATSADEITVTGSARDTNGSGIAKVEVLVDGGTPIEVDGGTSNWTYVLDAFALSDGAHTLESRATDIAGNVETDGNVKTIWIDNAAPAIDIESITPNPSGVGTVIVSVDAEDFETEIVSLTLTAGGVPALCASTDANSWGCMIEISSTSLNGVIQLIATATDAAGNTATTTGNLTVDTIAPTGTVFINDNDEFTNNISVSLTIEGAAGDMTQVRFKNEGEDWGNWASSDGGPFSRDLSEGDGQKTVFAQFKDAVGNESGVVSDTIILDTVDPNVALTYPLDEANVQVSGAGAEVAILGTAHDVISGIDHVDVEICPSVSILTGPIPEDCEGGEAVGDDPWSFTWNVAAEGMYDIHVEAYDKAGNETQSDMSVNVTFDGTTPSFSIISVDPYYAPLGPVMIDFSVDEVLNGTPNVTVNGQPAVVVSGPNYNGDTGNWDYQASYQVNAGSGEYVATLVISGTDMSGNSGQTSGQFEIDITDPMLSIHLPTQGAHVGGNLVTISGTASDVVTDVALVQVSIDGGDFATADGTTSWSYDWMDLALGDHLATVVVTDMAGNTETATRGFTVTFINYEDTDSEVVYSGLWNSAQHGAVTNQTLAYSNVTGSAAGMSFTGSGVTIVSAKGPMMGRAEIILDGNVVQTVDLYAKNLQPQVSIYSNDFPFSGNHTIGIKVKGTKNTKSSNTYVVLDMIQIR